MNYYSDNKILHLRYKNIENFVTYCKLFNKFSIKYIKNKYKKSIDLDLEDFDIIQRVDNKLKLYQILYDFFNKLSKIEINETNLDLENLIIVKHKVHKYFILGMTFNNVQNKLNRLNYFDYQTDKPITKQLKFLIFIPICNENVINNIELFFYNYEITVFTSSKVKLFNLPIITISEITNLKSILYFLKNNSDLLSYFDIIVIFDNTFFENIFQNDFILSLDNYIIVGNISNKSILDKKYENILRNYNNVNFNCNPVIYSNYSQILFSSYFLNENINLFLDKDIEELSLLCSYN